MKKKLWYLLALVCCLNFVACSDDDKDPAPTPPEDKDWTDYTGTFKTTNLLLNGSAAGEGVEATLTESGEKAKLVVKNIDFLIETSSLEIDGIEIKESTGGYSFEAKQTFGETDIIVTGTLSPGTRATEAVETSLTLTIKRKITSNIVGEWHLKYNENGGAAFNLGYTLGANAAALDEYTWNIMIGLFNSMVNVPGLIANKVEDVTIYFKEEGVLDFSWTPVGGSAVTLADALSGIAIPGIGEALQGLSFNYYTSGEQVFIGVDKTLLSFLPMLPQFVPAIKPYEALIELATSLFEIQGAYAFLPLNINSSEEGTSFLFPVPAQILSQVIPSLPSLLPEEAQGIIDEGMISELIRLMTVTESVNVSLDFTKK